MPDLQQAKARLKALRASFARRFEAGEGGDALARGMCREVDALLCEWWRGLAPQASATVDLLAVGGYGRGELAPHSDWDVWFLAPAGMPAAVSEELRAFLQFLWDAGVKPGQAVRDAGETLAHLREDWDSATAALEARHLAGPGEEWARLRRGLEGFFRKRRKAFVEAKLAEVEARHARTGGTAFLMEPDIKEGQGGLRDVQAVFWMARAWHQGANVADLIGKGALTAREYEHLMGARDFLLRCRFGLHQQVKRPSDRLGFEQQIQLAERMGYEARDGKPAVEWFMKDYFRHAGRIARVSGLLFMHFRELLHPRLFAIRRDIGDGFVLEGERVGLRDASVFREDPLRLLRIFHVGQQGHRYLSSEALRQIRADVELIDHIRDDPRAHELFLSILRSKRNVRWALKEMNDTGVLGRFIPEFREVVGLSQFNRYHAYTVDEHTIRAIGEARNFWHRERAIRLELASEVCHKIHRPELLYIALLFHDIAKGRPGDHSINGARMVRDFAQRIGLNRDAVELVEWLVREHLLMAVKSQRFDLSDPEVIEAFAERVGDVGRLNYLLLLTVADIAAVGPNVWNDWKGALLRELYEATASCFMNKGSFGEEAERRRRTRIETTLEILGGDAAAADWLARLPHALVMHFPPVQLAEIVRALTFGEAQHVRLWVDERRGETLAIVLARGRPGLFADLAAQIASGHADIVAAQAYGLDDGRVLDVFHLRSREGGCFDEPSDLARLEARIRRLLEGEGGRLREPSFRVNVLMRQVPVRVRALPKASFRETAIEVSCADRPGLLARLARAIHECDVEIHGASISTFGERAVDVFFVSERGGGALSEARIESLSARLREAARLPEGEA